MLIYWQPSKSKSRLPICNSFFLGWMGGGSVCGVFYHVEYKQYCAHNPKAHDLTLNGLYARRSHPRRPLDAPNWRDYWNAPNWGDDWNDTDDNSYPAKNEVRVDNNDFLCKFYQMWWNNIQSANKESSTMTMCEVASWQKTWKSRTARKRTPHGIHPVLTIVVRTLVCIQKDTCEHATDNNRP